MHIRIGQKVLHFSKKSIKQAGVLIILLTNISCECKLRASWLITEIVENWVRCVWRGECAGSCSSRLHRPCPTVRVWNKSLSVIFAVLATELLFPVPKHEASTSKTSVSWRPGLDCRRGVVVRAQTQEFCNQDIVPGKTRWKKHIVLRGHYVEKDYSSVHTSFQVLSSH